ncbi:hypothetical protein J7K60_00425, partial [Candidatus Bipolaricaulota bacterium]|nr:hypothetical protein [Candidatus Bipolaricaulota bacterium]
SLRTPDGRGSSIHRQTKATLTIGATYGKRKIARVAPRPRNGLFNRSAAARPIATVRSVEAKEYTTLVTAAPH